MTHITRRILRGLIHITRRMAAVASTHLSASKIIFEAGRSSSTTEDRRSDAYGYTPSGGTEMQNPKDKTPQTVQDLELLVRVRVPGETPAAALDSVVGTLLNGGVELSGPVEWSEAKEHSCTECDPNTALHELAQILGPAGILVGPYDPDTWN